ncbi:MAG: ArsA-related P-loop ATPase [Acidimicrobiales bacterium]|nr:ArsA-related P-loop ATPase [Acidimicrobiales bacterium]
MSYRDLVEQRDVIVCCGTGGVGKTTTAAATAMAAAQMGRRAAVVTIDPAKRLADALGIGALTNDPTVIDGPWPGTLAALMLDTKATFDDVVRRHAADDTQVDRILDNRFYVNVSTSLSGTQDYMAVEKLAELHASGDWDLVVVDTPPTRDALAFLEAPKLLTRLLDNAIYKLVISPQRGVLRAVNRAASSVVRQLSRVVGADVVDDAIEFFQAFQGMEEGFKERADATLSLLGADATAFVLVASPRADTLSEAKYFLDRLGAADMRAAAIVVNRMLPALSVDVDRAAELRSTLADTDAAGLGVALADHAAAAAGDEDRVGELLATAPDAMLARVPLLPSDVHDVETLTQIAAILTASTGV